MKLGILGTGMIVQDFLQTINALDFEKVVLLSTPHSQTKAREMVKSYGLDGFYLDYDELLHSDVDTIYNALPNHLHYAFSKKALEAHKNVIVEKTFTSNIQEAEELANLAKKNHCFILEAMTVHYMPAIQELRKDIKNIGQIKIVSLNYSQYSSRYDRFQQGEILPAFDYHKSGGALYDLNVYNLHFLLDLFGKPKSVDYMANIEKGIDTSGLLTLDYGDFKAVTIGAKDCSAPLMNTIQGNEGYIMINKPVSRIHEYLFVDQTKSKETKTFTNNIHAMFYEFEEMKRIIEERDAQQANKMLEISLRASSIMTAARRKAGIVFDADKD